MAKKYFTRGETNQTIHEEAFESIVQTVSAIEKQQAK